MNIDKFLKFFVPKNNSFFPLFERDAANMVKAAVLLKDMMDSSVIGEYERIYKAIKEVEHIGDEITKLIYDHLNKSFITPFDREDIHAMTAHIDDVVDSIDGISRRIYLYKPKKLIPVYKDMAEVIHSAALEIEKAIGCLADPVAKKEMIYGSCDMLTVFEHKADEIYFDGVAELFDKEDDSREILINNKLLELLEECVDEEKDVTDALLSILVKMT